GVAALGRGTPGAVVVFGALLGIANSFSTPAMMAFVPSLVEPAYLPSALALNSVTFNIGRAVGPVLGAVVIETAGPSWAYGLNSLSYLALVFGLTRVRALVPQARPATRPRLRDAIALVARDRRLLGLLYP